MPVSEKSNEQVFQEELLEIRKRRKVHVQQVEQFSEDAATDEQPLHDLTGLALSGGGVRAAAFSLGFIQAMCRAGRMKAFDYLSTVSGSGYAAGLFSATVVRHKGDINWQKEGRYRRLDLELLADGRQPDTVKQLSLYGRMMGDFVRLFSRHLWGFLVNVTFAISGLVAIAAILAYVMRIPWNRELLPVLKELGFQNDISVSFFFTFLAFLVWLLSQILRRVAKVLKKEIPPVTQYSYLLLLASLVLGLLTMLAIGNISLGSMLGEEGSNKALEKSVNRLVQWLGLGASGLFVSSLLPYLSPKRLLQSGQPGASRVQSIVFRTASNALVMGSPLFIYFFLVHEDVSGFNHKRHDSDQLTREHLKFPAAFAGKLESQATSLVREKRLLARQIYNVLNHSQYDDEFGTSNAEMRGELAQIRKLGEKKRVTDKEFGFVGRCLQWLANATPFDDRFERRVEDLRQFYKSREEVVRRFNQQILSDPGLFVRLEQRIKEDKKNPENKDKLSSKDQVAVESSRLLLQGFGLPTSTPKASEDSRLERALEELAGAHNQWTVRYSKPLKPNQVNSKTALWTFALMSLARQRVEANHVPAAVSAPQGNGTDKRNFWATGYRAASTLHLLLKESISGSLSDSGIDENHIFSIDGRVVTALNQMLADPESLKKQMSKILPAKAFAADTDESSTKYEGWLTKQAAAVQALSRKVRENNWMLLSQIYPRNVRTQETIFAYTVNAADQAYRLELAAYAALTFLLVGLLSNLNSTSLHGVYRDQLADMWLPDPDMRLQQLDTCSKGAPLHLINATVNRMGHRQDPDLEGRSRFLLSQRYCGTNKVGYRETRQYEGGSITVADAMAISGGAVTSVNAPSLLHQLILFMTNFRLGQWLANPRSHERDHYWPAPIRAILNLLWRPGQRSYLFISDGGHVDNTGLAALLERRCRLMVCVDASHDPHYEFTDLLHVLHGARAKYGIQVDAFDSAKQGIDISNVLNELRPGEHDQSPAHLVTFKIKYPEIETPAILIYSKLTVTGEEPIEIVERARATGHFPHDPTSDQFLPPEVFESYMMLGRHVGEEFDDFVDGGAIDSFDLGQGWQHASKGEGGKSTNLRQPTAITLSADSPTSQVPALAQIQRMLEGVQFDQAGVTTAMKILDQWYTSVRQQVGGAVAPIDPSVIEIVSPWAQEHGPAAPKKLRREFCDVLKRHVENLGPAIQGDSTLRSHYRNMLDGLGAGVAGISKTLKKLIQHDAPA